MREIMEIYPNKVRTSEEIIALLRQNGFKARMSFISRERIIVNDNGVYLLLINQGNSISVKLTTPAWFKVLSYLLIIFLFFLINHIKHLAIANVDITSWLILYSFLLVLIYALSKIFVFIKVKTAGQKLEKINSLLRNENVN